MVQFTAAANNTLLTLKRTWNRCMVPSTDNTDKQVKLNTDIIFNVLMVCSITRHLFTTPLTIQISKVGAFYEDTVQQSYTD